MYLLKQSLRIFIRRFVNDPVFSIITLLSLIFGFTAFIVLSLFISGIFTSDKHNINYDRVYRVQLFMDQKDNTINHSASITAALSRHVLPPLPEIEKIALIHDVGNNNKNGVFISPDKKTEYLTRWGYYADPDIFQILTFRFTEGDPDIALSQPMSLVLSETLAKKLFPETSAIGRTVYLENKVILTVTGVYKDINRSTFEPSFIIPMQSFTATTGWKGYEDNYWAYSFETYVLLKKNANPRAVDAKIHDALKNYRKKHYPYLRPLSQLFINPYFQPDYYIAISILGFNALLVLILSAINYINLQTANASTRFREIGIRKTVGFTRKQLWSQFILESVMLSFLSGILSIILCRFLTPAFNVILGGKLLENIFYDWKMIVFILVISLLTGLLSGIHPAFVISAYNPVSALKQKFIQAESNGINLKKILVTAQFSISIFLLTVGLIMYRQTEYMVNRDMGFESHRVIFANIVTAKQGDLSALRQKLLEHPEIENMCYSDYIPFILPGGNDMSWEDAYPDQKVFVRYSNISHDFVPTYHIQMKQGRNFSREYPSDDDKCLINETAVRIFGWSDPVGHRLKVFDKYYTVIGVISDYIVFSVHNPIEPHLYRLLPDTVKSDMIYSVSFKVGKEKKASQIATRVFEDFFPDDAFEFANIQTRIQNENAVREWRHLMKISIAFAVISLIVSSIGLFGLILFFCRQKMKELGIRKVLGFSWVSLYTILSSGFIRLFFISIVFAWPAAWYAYKSLPGANKYPIQIWEFLIATAVILIVALATISYQILRALKVRPVEILKEE